MKKNKNMLLCLTETKNNFVVFSEKNICLTHFLSRRVWNKEMLYCHCFQLCSRIYH